MKRLKSTNVPETEDVSTVKAKVTDTVLGVEDLAENARKKLFLIKPEILSAEFFYLPCWRVVLDFRVSFFKADRADRGQVEFIVDPIKGCGANEEELELNLIRKRIPEELISDQRVDKEEAVRKAMVDARWKVLLARYKKPAELELAKAEEFYRPYYRCETAWGSKVEIQNIAADEFGNYFVYN